jgi:hypothetical protein
MKAAKAIVTLAIGDKYHQHWKHSCEVSWNAYGRQHGFDVICIDKPLDDSERARKRSPAWQKCLILSQEFSQHYERIIWIDSDILINNHAAPAIDDGVPLEKVGAVEEFTYAHEAGAEPHELLQRLYSYWGKAVINYTPEEYYTKFGLPGGFNNVVQTGVLVMSPQHHRAVLEKVYNDYEEKGGSEWNYEMRPLSYELLKANAVHWIDRRFNLVWTYSLFLHYPFLLNPHLDDSLSGRLKRKVAAVLGVPSFVTLQRACLTAAFLDSFFFHISGGSFEQVELVNQAAKSFLDCGL